MSPLFNGKPSKDILKRFPESKYTVIRVPYVNITLPERIVLQVLQPEHVKQIDSMHIKYATAVFHKLNWSAKNDLMRMSQKFDQRTWKFGIDFDQYQRNVIEKHLICIIDEDSGEERVGSYQLLKDLDKEFVDGVMDMFLSEGNRDSMDEMEEVLLRKDIHTYYAYWRKVYSTNQLDQLSIQGKEPPICPSIIIESDMAEKYGWTLEYIRNLSPRDIKALQILNDQKSIAQFEANPENGIVGIGGGLGSTFMSGGEMYRKIDAKEQEELMQEQPEVIFEKPITENTDTEAPATEQPTVQPETPAPGISMIEQFIKQRNIKSI